MEKAEQLSEKEQEAIAALIMDEINWNTTLSQTQNKLANLAEDALDEYRKGKTKPLDL